MWYCPIQKHTDAVQILTNDLTPQVADAVVTDLPNLMIAVRTADCVPILLYDPVKQMIGAVHAGWRGTAAGIMKKAIAVCIEHFDSHPADILMAVGPAICGTCYEVGDEVVRDVCQTTGHGSYVSNIAGHYHIDLREANRIQALNAGILAEHIWSSTDCTHCMPDRYFSYRYAQGSTGRLHSCIVLEPCL